VLKPLTSLRFFAALLVFGGHVPLTFAVATHHLTGQAGVEFFFLLSGFILIYAHRELFSGRVTFAQVKDFWVARFARIYPVHILAFCVGMYMVVRTSGFGWFFADAERNSIALITQLTLTQSWLQIDSMINYNMLAWSLSDEAFFYAVFPVLAVALFALANRTRPWSLGVLAVALWGIGVYLALAIRDSWFFYTFPPIRLIDFAIGACLGIAFVNLGERARLRSGVATALEIVAVAGIAVAIFLTPRMPAQLGYAFWLAPFCAFAIYVFAHERGLLSKLLSTAAFVYLGEISYSFYMLHVLVLTVIFERVWRFPIVVTVISLVMCVGISAIVYERFEKPLRKRIRGLFTEAAPVPAVA
jgi:peptidoglycan/LPS O-acetylase OafA/YrhL